MIGSLQSELELEFRYDESRGRTILCRRRAGGLAHVSKPYWDGEVLLLQMVNPTAGIFAGDELRSKVRIGERAQVALTTPSATRFHTMADGRARIAQEFLIEDGAWLDYQPEWVIAQRDSEVEQTTRIRLAGTARMVFFDLLAPGRVAHGECCAYRKHTTTFELFREENLVVRERMELTPDGEGWPLRVAGWKSCYYASVWVVGGRGSTAFSVLERWERSFPVDEVKCGVSEIEEGIVVGRFLSPRSLALKRALAEVRKEIIPALPLLALDQRRI